MLCVCVCVLGIEEGRGEGGRGKEGRGRGEGREGGEGRGVKRGGKGRGGRGGERKGVHEISVNCISLLKKLQGSAFTVQDMSLEVSVLEGYVSLYHLTSHIADNTHIL